MELGARTGIARHHGGDRAAVVRLRDQTIAFRGVEMKGMHEVRVQSLRPGGDAVKQRMRAQRLLKSGACRTKSS